MEGIIELHCLYIQDAPDIRGHRFMMQKDYRQSGYKEENKLDIDRLFSGFGIGFVIVAIMIIFIFLLITVVFIMSISKSFSRRTDNQAIKQSVFAEVIGKRTLYAQTINNVRNVIYYVTFQTENAERIELHVPEDEYGLLIEGDKGQLVFHRKEFYSFDRKST